MASAFALAKGVSRVAGFVAPQSRVCGGVGGSGADREGKTR